MWLIIMLVKNVNNSGLDSQTARQIGESADLACTGEISAVINEGRYLNIAWPRQDARIQIQA